MAIAPTARTFAAAYASTPFFVIGCGRSGTTLTRLMLDSHPRLSVPTESHFILSHRDRFSALGPVATLDRILAEPRFQAFALDPDRVRVRVRDAAPRTYAQLISATFATYAERDGKPRWGDKTTSSALHVPELADLFPTAPFIHVIRDGREVAASLVSQPWGPASVIDAARHWAIVVSTARRQGRRLGPERYAEVLLHELVADPERELRKLCAHLGEDYSPAMLDYPQGGAAITLTRTDSERLRQPPTPGGRDWRAALSRADQAGVEAVCRRQLAAFGFEPAATPAVSAYVRAWGSMAPRKVAALRTRPTATSEHLAVPAAAPSGVDLALWRSALASAPAVVVGSGRVGTSLVRAALDAHPELAVPPVSPFVVAPDAGAFDPEGMLAAFFDDPRSAGFGVDPDRAREAVAATGPRTYAELIRTLFATRAALLGKRRWGVEAPAARVSELAGWFDGGRFIHVIEDGRTAAARRDGTGSALQRAHRWSRDVAAVRRAGRRLTGGIYTEVRVEALRSDPEAELRRLCRHLGVAFAPEMLGSLPAPGGEDWRAGLSRLRQAAIQARCHRQLEARWSR